MSTNVKSIFIWSLFTLYIYFGYHLLVIPAFLDFSIYGILSVVLTIGLLIWLTPSSERKRAFTGLIAILLLDKALHNSSVIDNSILYILSVMIIIILIGLLCKLYGKLSLKQIMTFTLIILVFSTLFNRSEVRILNNFTKVWESRTLYAGNMFDYFPIEVKDVNNDGVDEIITFGNIEEVESELVEEEMESEEESSYILEPEPIYPYVFSWNGKQMERIPSEAINNNEFNHILNKDYVGFPFYSLTTNNKLEPLISRQDLVERSMQVGNSPFLAMELVLQNIDQLLNQSNQKTAVKETFSNHSSFENVVIENGVISGSFKGKAFQQETDKTNIIGSLQFENNQERLVLAGKDLALYKAENEELVQTHVLTDQMVPDLIISEFIIADIDQDQRDEILLTSNGSSILKPMANGEWEMLWKSKDSSYRFEDFKSLGSQKGPEIIALAKSEVRNQPLRFITGFEYTENGLKRKWKSHLSFINVHAADIDGDQQNELIASVYKSHKIYVFDKHSFPAQLVLLILTGLLIMYGIVRRVRHGR